MSDPTTPNAYIESTPGVCGGKPRIRGHRIRVQDIVVWHEDPDVARGLGVRGIDVTTAQEAGLLEAPDTVQLAFAHTNGRVLITHDADFLRLHARGALQAGVCYCRPAVRTLGQIIEALLLMHGCLDAEDMKQHVEFL